MPTYSNSYVGDTIPTLVVILLKGLPQCGKVLLSPGQDTGGADSGALIWREAVLIVLKALIALLELIRQFIE
ncbi:damage-inducible type I toxin DinQ [Escherichia coli]|uniref:damage-inducible type I toxin DinQ n=1 Tax=Escherichia coli TaxID=562 RepID=UPI00333B3832